MKVEIIIAISYPKIYPRLFRIGSHEITICRLAYRAFSTWRNRDPENGVRKGPSNNVASEGSIRSIEGRSPRCTERFGGMQRARSSPRCIGGAAARMRPAADTRGKYKYVKARPEFSYS